MSKDSGFDGTGNNNKSGNIKRERRQRQQQQEEEGYKSNPIEIKSPKELDILRDCAAIASDVLSKLSRIIAPGLATIEFDELARREIAALGAEPAFVGYRGYPSSVCVSINDELVHGIPSGTRRLKSGDIVSLDLGVRYNGFYGDVAATYPVGAVPDNAAKIIKAGRDTFEEALIKNSVLKARVAASSGVLRLGDISSAIEEHIKSRGFSVVRDYVGHGIGRHLHEEPPVPNFGRPSVGPVLKEGMVLAVEPMLVEGDSAELTLDKDGWTARSASGKLTSHFEHMIIIKSGGDFEIITRW